MPQRKHCDLGNFSDQSLNRQIVFVRSGRQSRGEAGGHGVRDPGNFDCRAMLDKAVLPFRDLMGCCTLLYRAILSVQHQFACTAAALSWLAFNCSNCLYHLAAELVAADCSLGQPIVLMSSSKRGAPLQQFFSAPTGLQWCGQQQTHALAEQPHAARSCTLC